MAAEIVDGVEATGPVVVLHANRVVAASDAARAEGIRRGLRKREAQSRCPGLVAVDHDPARDARAFEPVVAAVEEMVAGVEVVRPGMCALAARGPARYFGGEEIAAERIVEHVAQSCGVESQVGVADGGFAAGLAAREGVIVPSGKTVAFLATRPVEALARPELAELLRRLGITTLGAFAGLSRGDVMARFGFDAALAHRLASGGDERPLAVRRPPPDLGVGDDYGDDPLERVDVAAFAARSLAERLHERLAGYGLACTRLAIEAVTAHGQELRRVWRHDGLLTTATIADRVRWQLDGWLSGTARVGGQTPPSRPTAGIVRLRLVPEGVLPHAGLQPGLWGETGEEKERAHRAFNRIQGILGPESVVSAVPGGGRSPADRIRFVPWGDEPTPARPDAPWPGRMPAPAPALVLPAPLPATVRDTAGEPVGVSARLLVTAAPARLRITPQPSASGFGAGPPLPAVGLGPAVPPPPAIGPVFGSGPPPARLGVDPAPLPAGHGVPAAGSGGSQRSPAGFGSGSRRGVAGFGADAEPSVAGPGGGSERLPVGSGTGSRRPVAVVGAESSVVGGGEVPVAGFGNGSRRLPAGSEVDRRPAAVRVGDQLAVAGPGGSEARPGGPEARPAGSGRRQPAGFGVGAESVVDGGEVSVAGFGGGTQRLSAGSRPGAVGVGPQPSVASGGASVAGSDSRQLSVGFAVGRRPGVVGAGAQPSVAGSRAAGRRVDGGASVAGPGGGSEQSPVGFGVGSRPGVVDSAAGGGASAAGFGGGSPQPPAGPGGGSRPLAVEVQASASGCRDGDGAVGRRDGDGASGRRDGVWASGRRDGDRASGRRDGDRASEGGLRIDAERQAGRRGNRGRAPAAVRGDRRDVGEVEIVGWVGPWPVDERWWAPAEARRRARFQVSLADGSAVLLSLAAGQWSVEAIYD